ncbi:MAG: hypothetical protein ABIJ09_00505 [Pseudomonadota bacterium]
MSDDIQDPVEPQDAAPTPSDDDKETALAAKGEATVDDDDEAAPPVQARAPAVDVPYDVAFRLSVYWDIAKGQYGVRCDELGNLQVWAETRAQALQAGEAALEDRVGAYAVRGEALPRPFDLDRPQDFSGQLELRVSKGLHRDLVHLARRERCSVEQLTSELLAQGLAERRNEGRPRETQGRDRPGDRHDARRDDRGDRDRNRRGMSRDRYSQVMEDKASFMEYVRGLDQGGGGPGGGGRGRRGR